ncbi:MAG: ABC transporter substrate-binding protein [Myxococcota bacterium]
MDRPERIVSLSPLATRFLVALGAADRLVAVDAESHRREDVGERPVVELGDVVGLDADLLLLPTLPDDFVTLDALEATGLRVVELAPHDLEDVFALCRGLGRELVGAERAEAFERRIARPIALVAGRSPSVNRPRVLAVTRVQPLELAGGHSFETDLIEAAGGTSVTHGSEDHRRAVELDAVRRLAPDVLLVTSDAPLGAADQDRAIRRLGDIAPVVFFDYAGEGFWLDAPERDVERLRSLLHPAAPSESAEAD